MNCASLQTSPSGRSPPPPLEVRRRPQRRLALLSSRQQLRRLLSEGGTQGADGPLPLPLHTFRCPLWTSSAARSSPLFFHTSPTPPIWSPVCRHRPSPSTSTRSFLPCFQSSAGSFLPMQHQASPQAERCLPTPDLPSAGGLFQVFASSSTAVKRRVVRTSLMVSEAERVCVSSVLFPSAIQPPPPLVRMQSFPPEVLWGSKGSEPKRTGV